MTNSQRTLDEGLRIAEARIRAIQPALALGAT